MTKLRRFMLSAAADAPRWPHLEKLISGLGALIAIFFAASLNSLLIPDLGTPLIVASLGASAVLLFATPHSPFTQPWPLLGGQAVSATVGMACALYIPHLPSSAALAVGLTLVFMYYLRCLHPPGGATALSAVLGDGTIHNLGFQYVLMPVLLDTVAIIVIAVLFNYLFPWRRYPLGLSLPRKTETPDIDTETLQAHFTDADIDYALRNMDSFVDVSAQDLLQLYRLASQHAESVRMRPEQIQLGHFYSNGRPGGDAELRKVIDQGSEILTPAKDKIIYRILIGTRAGTTGLCTRAEFARWAKFEVVKSEEGWKRVD